MAATALLVARLQRHLDRMEKYEDKDAVLIEEFFAVATLIPRYFECAVTCRQSKEHKESSKRYHWGWPEIPAFPLRNFISPSARALQRFPRNMRLAMVLADLFIDICRWNMLNKEAPLKEGIVKAFLGSILSVLTVAPVDFTALGLDEACLIHTALAAVNKCSLTPSNTFYDTVFKVKSEFFARGREAWTDTKHLRTLIDQLPWPEEAPNRTGVNEALQVVTYLLHYLPSDSTGMQSLLQLLKNISEAFGSTLPIHGNLDFLKYLRMLLNKVHTELEELQENLQGATLPIEFTIGTGDYQWHIWMVDEALLIVKRTDDPESVPYKHMDVFFHGPLFEHFCESNHSSMVVDHIMISHTNIVREGDRKMYLEVAERLSGKEKRVTKCARCSEEWKYLDPNVVKYKKCSRCQMVESCSKECQVEDRKTHKKQCVKKVQAPPET